MFIYGTLKKSIIIHYSANMTFLFIDCRLVNRLVMVFEKPMQTNYFVSSTTWSKTNFLNPKYIFSYTHHSCAG